MTTDSHDTPSVRLVNLLSMKNIFFFFFFFFFLDFFYSLIFCVAPCGPMWPRGHTCNREVKATAPQVKKKNISEKKKKKKKKNSFSLEHELTFPGVKTFSVPLGSGDFFYSALSVVFFLFFTFFFFFFSKNPDKFLLIRLYQSQ